MASRALLQRLCSRRAISLSPRVSALSALHYSNTLKSSASNNIVKTKQCNTFNRHFSSSGQWNKDLKTMSEEEVSGLKVQEERLMRDLHDTCEWGKGERWGR